MKNLDLVVLFWHAHWGQITTSGTSCWTISTSFWIPKKASNTFNETWHDCRLCRYKKFEYIEWPWNDLDIPLRARKGLLWTKIAKTKTNKCSEIFCRIFWKKYFCIFSKNEEKSTRKVIKYVCFQIYVQGMQ